MKDYEDRSYLSVTEVASYLGLTVKRVHHLVRSKGLKSYKSAGGQYRFDIKEVKKIAHVKSAQQADTETAIKVGNTTQTLYLGDSRRMDKMEDESVHLVITSPPYFNAKMYSQDNENDLGNIHELEQWLDEISKVWGEVFRVLQPGRKFFLNIMNLPVRSNGSFRALNLIGKTVDICEEVGFVFKRDIIWHKTNGVRAHFGTYPYPGGILINNMHEFILEFQKPMKAGTKKYAHLTGDAKEQSKLEKDFWLSLKNSDVWVMKPEKSGGNREHIAPFPLELPLRLIKAYSFVGETILDPFLGSGTTLKASSLTERNGIGYELNGDFLNYAIERLRKEQGKLL